MFKTSNVTINLAETTLPQPIKLLWDEWRRDRSDGITAVPLIVLYIDFCKHIVILFTNR